ncbi:PHA/PHB synthase family protein [Loktanella sp. M215]|uniref:PHA/PHB synthase family protein n=1 Tax=Loktanella sp. M215 TaxID=2675431 RepID=UPI001F43FD4B|nr:alpha/beta fold hydrolase [Loktanella sp. M215]MCF7701438.1 alpha/beta fold hydrolase [Loktanella sp. M215]
MPSHVKQIVPQPNTDTPPEVAVPPKPETTYQALDRKTHAHVAQATLGLAPSVLGEAWMDWAVHMATSPGKQMELAQQALADTQAFWTGSLGLTPATVPDDRRFASDAWRVYPFNVLAQTYHRNWQLWQDATTGVHGVATPHENLMAFTAGLLTDAAAPSNFALTNPDVLAATVQDHGTNILQGLRNLSHDITHKGEVAPSAFVVGRDLAATPGKVVFRNDLIELIQYAPTTDTVRPEPILIVPAWIMKYYILDLSRQNSLVGFLVAQGFTVFIVSWKNPDASDRDRSMEDYRKLGVMAALDAVEAITSAPKVHAVGYCLGGTLLAIAAAAMGRDKDDRLASVTLLAAQVDFTEAGPLKLFINEAEVTLIEDIMDAQGFLTSDQMAGAFALLHARDRIWAPIIRDYMLGQRGDAFDLMAWNADATRMPARMHAEYLRQLFLHNDLAEGHYRVGGKAVALTDIAAPIFAVGTEDDHVAPWQSVYKLHLFADTDVTFVLTSGGHNAGIVSEPGHHDRHFRSACTPERGAFRDPAAWLEANAAQDGSWWPVLTDWLQARSGPEVAPPPMGKPDGRYAVRGDAPGTYVMQR